MSSADDADTEVLTYARAAELLACDVNTVRTRTEKHSRYRRVPTATRPAKIYAKEVYEDRAELLHKLKACELAEAAPATVSAPSGAADPSTQALIEENSRLRADLANALEAARVLLLSDSAKNDLIRQYLYDDPHLGASDLD